MLKSENEMKLFAYSFSLLNKEIEIIEMTTIIRWVNRWYMKNLLNK